MNVTKKHFASFGSVLLLLFSTTPQLQAAVDLSEEFKLNENQSVSSVFGSPGDLISVILPNVFIISGIILLFMIIFGGFLVVSSAGGNPEQTQKGRQAITGAIIGFVVVFSSYWIVQIIEIITGLQLMNPIIPGF